jgi:hypothetical protein
MLKFARLLIIGWTAIPGFALVFSSAAAGASCPQVGFTIVEPHASAETRPVDWNNQTIFVRRMPITTTSDITEIKLSGDDFNASLDLKFTPAATKRLIQATNNHRGRRIAFMFNDEVLLNIMIPGSQGFGAAGAEVSMRHGMESARRLMKAIRGCTGATATTRKP